MVGRCGCRRDTDIGGHTKALKRLNQWACVAITIVLREVSVIEDQIDSVSFVVRNPRGLLIDGRAAGATQEG